MTSLIHWLSPSAMQSLGWALLHFLWQGTALAALAGAAMALSRRASVRYAIGVAALALMFLAPLATGIFYAQEHSIRTTMHSSFAPPRPTLAVPAMQSIAQPRTYSPPSERKVPSALPWLVEAWLFGVAFFSLRSAGGFFLLERERRRRSSVVPPQVLEICYALQDQLGIKRVIQFCECAWLQAPAVIGWFRPIVFLPISVLTGLSDEQLQMVIAHELAHIQRLDTFVNVFQVCVETLLFYHPAVWWLNKKIRAEREHCCDEIAVSLCGDAVAYARALTLMEEWRSAPVFAMAANRGPLRERVIRVLGLKTLGSGVRGAGLTASVLCLTAALVAGNALVGMAHPRLAQASASLSPSSSPSAKPQAATTGTPQAKPSAAHAQSTPSPAAAPSSESYIDSMKAAGLNDLTTDQLIALRIQDVTAEYVRELHDQNIHPDADKLIAMRVQGITPEYVRELHDAGLNPTADQLIALKVQDVNGQYLREMKDAGIQPDIDRLVGLKVQDVTPEYVRELHAAGLSPTADQVIALKIQDVTPDYLKKMRDAGLQPNANDAIAMRIQDVTPEYVHAIQALGYKPSVNELISMRIQDVTPEYVKALQGAGFKPNINDVVSAKIQDVTPEFIERAMKHGFKDLDLHKLIQLRQLGILDSKADI